MLRPEALFLLLPFVMITRSLFAAALALASFSPVTLQARLGETEQQTEQRYGAAVEKLGEDSVREKTRAYTTGGMSVIVSYLNGVSQSEMFIKEDRKSDLSDNEIQVLLKANSLGRVWEKAESPNFINKRWLLQGEAVAEYRPMQITPTLWLATKQYVTFSSEQTRQKEKNALAGF